VTALLVLLAVLLLAYVIWFAFYVRRQLRRYSPMSAGYQRMPLLGRVALAYNRYLWIAYAELLRATRVPADHALRTAASRMPPPLAGQWDACANAPGLMGDLSIAAQLGKLDDEVRFQRDATVDAFLTELARCRRRTRIGLSILVYFLVAAFVSAMYLPIFSIGSAI